MKLSTIEILALLVFYVILDGTILESVKKALLRARNNTEK